MPVNRNALIRYKTIDKCLQNRYRLWTLDDLIDACSDALYEYEGIDKGVSKRTVQADIQMMRSDKLGYNAPIIVKERKYYTYEEVDYSITNIPITDQDLGKLGEAVEFLKQFKGFSHFKELDSMVQKLEDHVYSQKTKQKPVIEFEKNENLKGIQFLEELYQAIIKKKTLSLTYKSFKARQASTFNFYPYLLKEFRNRWFLIGSKKRDAELLNLALDRIIKIDPSEVDYASRPDFDAEEYFKHAIGVSVSPSNPPEEVILFVTSKHAPYVLTKPFHWSQELIEKDNYGITISLKVQHNFELEKDILGLGDGIKVIAPERLRRNIKERLNGCLDLYNTEIKEAGLITSSRKLLHKGFSVLNYVYTQRDIKRMKAIIDKQLKEKPIDVAQRNLLFEIPELKEVLFNKNLKRIIKSVDENAFLTKAIFFDKTINTNWYVTWHQDITINVTDKIETEGFNSWTQKDNTTSVCPPEEILKNMFTIRIHLDETTEQNGALQLVPGSHKKRLNDEEISLITSNCIPAICEVGAGGIQLMKPLLLHKSAKIKGQKRRRVIHLEFSSKELPNELSWAEKEEIG